MKLHLAGIVIGSTLGVSGALLVACSSSSNPQPGGITTYDAAGGGDSTAPDTGSPAPDSGTAETGADVTQPPQDAQGDVASDAVSDAPPSCTAQLTDAGCWTCPAKTDASLEYLNQCSGTGVRCVPFSNAALPGYDAGGLPALN
jgi:hypothetical protein